MGLIRWLVEAVILTIAVNFLMRLFSGRPPVRAGGPRQGQGDPRQAPGGRSAERAGGALVRDPQCGTYVPQSRAIHMGSGASAHYFCSEQCRAAYAEAHPQ